MQERIAPISALILVLVACGGGNDSAETNRNAERAGGAGGDVVPEGDARSTEPAGSGASGQQDGVVLNEVPDPCDYFTRDDAEAVLGEATGSGKSYDAGGWNCVYDTQGENRRRIVFDMYVARGDAVEDSQIGMTVEACAAEVVARYDDLGRDAALYRQTAAHCNGGHFLWVLTDARFEGRLRPEFERDTQGPIQVLLSVSPVSGEQQAASLTRQAARRSLDRLEG